MSHNGINSNFVACPRTLPLSFSSDVFHSALCLTRLFLLIFGARLQAFLTPDETTGRVKVVGNITEGALLMLLQKWGVSYESVRSENKPKL